ncbi:class II glutamine amidotransferase [Amnibacterium sp. CER49]|uniref:class II glutamine amidotransferase n=1 Tax=Amnibacterium sp. CER49 TaxID=3039161 RepID=UPI002449119E|nr:class II glutamine amidotransferase [Amnibacterium sp. CER49]MDH2444493.1 class II glutamine amidotransferase [Amnibacterium sp. CER49]
MCRLLAYVSRTPTTLTEVLGADALQRFVDLARQHTDGWGLAWATEDGVGTARYPDPAHESPEFARVSQEHRTDAAVAHVRWATDGLAIDVRNTHPFTDGRIAFAHNGAIRPATRLDELVAEDVRGLREGTTDSERYYLSVLDKARRMDVAAALAETTTAIAEGGFDYTCLNAMVLTSTELVVANRFRPEAEALEGPEYYRLRYRVTPDAVVVASTGWGGDGWRSLENGQLLVVQRHTLEVDVRDLAEVAAAA